MSKFNRSRRANATGRNEYNRYVQLHHWMLNSPAYVGLRPVARALLIELARLYYGTNNGEIGLGERAAAARLNMTDRRAVRRAFNELQAAGFIVMTRRGSFSMKARGERRANEWRLTWLPAGDEKKPTADFMRPPAEQNQRGWKAIQVGGGILPHGP